MADFNIAVDKTLKHEGRLSQDKTDPGGTTNYGISQHSFPDLDIKSLTREQAEAIYRRDYWHELYDQIADQRVANALFDFGVNAGPKEAVKVFQQALQRIVAGPVVADGEFGPRTLEATNSADSDRLLAMFVALRVDAYRKCEGADRYFVGWVKRALDW